MSGQPGVGKTSVLLRAVDVLKGLGYRVGGMVSGEVRERGVRVGFEIIDLSTGQRGWLAHVDQPTGPQVSKYRVNLEDLNSVGARSILNAVRDAEVNVIVVDEVGTMELFSKAFKEAVLQAVNSSKPVIGIVHYKARDTLIQNIRAREDAEIFEVTQENRGSLHTTIVDRVVESVRKHS